MKDILKIVFVIIGTLIGAGFASGQEMYVFFFAFGMKGFIGILISSILMGLIIYKVLKIINDHEIKNYKELLEVLIPGENNNKIKKIINCLVNLFILITFFIMIAGFGAYFEQEFEISSLIRKYFIISFMFFYIPNKYKRCS